MDESAQERIPEPIRTLMIQRHVIPLLFLPEFPIFF